MDVVPVPAALTRRADAIRALDPPTQSESFLAASWRSKVPRREVEYLVDAFPDGKINRQDLFTLGKVAVAGDAEDRRRLLVGTLMWGYGPKGGRSYTNANKVLALSTLDRKLAKCAEEIDAANVAGAFSAISGLGGYGIGFFTKFLYFSARERDWGEDAVKPLIFDSVVEDSLKFLRRAFDVRWDAKLTGRRKKVARYLRYCATAHAWANDLDLQGGVVGAEKIEQFLFRPSAFTFDTASEMRKLAEAVARDRRAGLAGPQTAAVNINPDLLASVDAPPKDS